MILDELVEVKRNNLLDVLTENVQYSTVTEDTLTNEINCLCESFVNVEEGTIIKRAVSSLMKLINRFMEWIKRKIAAVKQKILERKKKVKDDKPKETSEPDKKEDEGTVKVKLSNISSVIQVLDSVEKFMNNLTGLPGYVQSRDTDKVDEIMLNSDKIFMDIARNNFKVDIDRSDIANFVFIDYMEESYSNIPTEQVSGNITKFTDMSADISLKNLTFLSDKERLLDKLYEVFGRINKEAKKILDAEEDSPEYDEVCKQFGFLVPHLRRIVNITDAAYVVICAHDRLVDILCGDIMSDSVREDGDYSLHTINIAKY